MYACAFVERKNRRCALCDEECQRMTCRNQDGGEFDFLASTIEISFLFQETEEERVRSAVLDRVQKVT